MYSLMRQPHRPTTIEHCISCKFVSKSEENLVVAGTTQLQVFAIREASEKSRAKSRTSSTTSSPTCSDKLELVFHCSLHGVVTELQSAQVGGGGRDALLIAFDDGKVSLVEYDPGTHDLVTLAILHAELAEYQGGMHQPTLRPMLRVDPEQRCAALIVYDRYLIVCPLRREEASASRSMSIPHYAVELHTLDAKLHNVLDIQFLHGYYEPTLFVLFEPTRTCPGRVAARQDTVSLVAVSLSLMERVHPVIWSFDNLPCDCFKALPVPKPIGGIVVFAVNSLLYLNQSVPPYGVSLNSIAESSSHFPLRQQEGVTLSLDCAQACFISSDRFVMSLRGGEIYVVCLKADSMRMVRDFEFDHAAASVLTCCICTIADKHLFLGSRLGNSLLLRCTQKSQAQTSAQLEPAAKRRVPSTADWLASGLDEDELEVYGSALDSDSTSASYSFEVCDSLINVGPLSSTCLGEPSFLSDEYHSVDKYDLELVSCSGYGKNGCLSVLQQTIRPQLVTTFQLQGCTDMWTVLSGKSEQCCRSSSRSSTHDADTDSRHSFLILAREDKTMILRTGSEILELDQSGFDTNSATIYAGNIGEKNYILQVCPQGVRLLDGEDEVQSLPAPAQFTRCSLVSPHVILLCDDGTVCTLTLDESGTQPMLILDSPSLDNDSPISACCLYRDDGGLFSTNIISAASAPRESRRSMSATVEIKKEIVPGVSNISGLTAEEEDELLYGGVDVKPAVSPTLAVEEDPDEVLLYADSPAFDDEGGQIQAPPVAEEAAGATYWCVVCRQNGSLEILSFPAMAVVFSVPNFTIAPRCLVDAVMFDAGLAGDQSDLSPILEVLVAGLGPSGAKPYLMARSAQDLQIYQAFQYPSSCPGERLNIRFTKVRHDIVLHDHTAAAPGKTNGEKSSEEKEAFIPLLRRFDNIGSNSGIFFCGGSPHWIFMTQRGALRCHPMMVDGHVTCFAPFDNVNCPQGFLYFNANSELRIAVLPRNLMLDSDWPVRKVPLRCTPHFVCYLPESKIYGVVTSKVTARKVAPHTTNDDAAILPELEEGERFMYPEMHSYCLQLYSPAAWEIVPNATVEFEEFESVVSMQVVRLQSEQTLTGLKSYLALATCSDKGEEVTARSMIKIYDIAEVVPEPDKPLTKYKLKVCYDKEMKGPVCAIGSVRGYMVGVVGQKVYVWSFMGGKDLIGVAFVDTHLFVHSITSIKDFILVADIQKSVSLLRFDHQSRSLSVVSRDFQHLEVMATNFIVDNKKLGFIVSDMMNNLIVFGYHPEALESQGGKMLLRRADIHVGTRVSSLWRTAVRPAALQGLSLVMRRDKRHVTWFSGMDGSVGYIIPVAEKTYRRLLRLQDKLITSLPHYAGLHPKGFRLLRTARPALVNPHRNILDGELLMNFVYASKMEQRELARSLGTTPNMILSDLVDVNYSSCLY